MMNLHTEILSYHLNFISEKNDMGNASFTNYISKGKIMNMYNAIKEHVSE